VSVSVSVSVLEFVVCLIEAGGSSRLCEQLEMLEMSELLWSLCEILLIDIVPGSFNVIAILDRLQGFCEVYTYLQYMHITQTATGMQVFHVAAPAVWNSLSNVLSHLTVHK